MKILFLIGQCTFGEVYFACQAARHLEARSHKVSFAFMSEELEMIKHVMRMGFKVRAKFGWPSTCQGAIIHEMISPPNFDSDFKKLLSGDDDVMVLFDYHHFFIRFPGDYGSGINLVRDELEKCSKRIFINDSSLWSLTPSPFPELSQFFEPAAPFLDGIFFSSPPIYHDYEGMLPIHHKVFFFDHLLRLGKKRKPTNKVLKVFIGISNLISTTKYQEQMRAPEVPVLIEQSLRGLAKLKEKVSLFVPVFGVQFLKSMDIPKNIGIESERSGGEQSFDDYDEDLRKFDIVILFNRISATITRALLLQVPVLLITHTKESAKRRGTVPFNIYPAEIPPIDLMDQDNPLYNHCRQCDLFDDVAIAKNLKAIVKGKTRIMTKDIENFLCQLPSPADFFIPS